MLKKLPHNSVVPFKESGQTKKAQVELMFDEIAGRYDLLNRLFSARTDTGWRKKAVKKLAQLQPTTILDIATGTGDMAILAHKLLKTPKITGIDISEQMIGVGRKKIAKLGLENNIALLKTDAEAINFNDNAFDAAMAAFGIRNFENLEVGLSEVLRVLKSGGRLVVLEFSTPRQPIKFFYNFYMGIICPAIARIFRQNKMAYQYLNKSSNAFPDREQLIAILNKAGFVNSSYQSLSLGICCIYIAEKK